MRIRMLALAAGTAMLFACSGGKTTSSGSSGGSGGTTGGTCDPTTGATCPCSDNSQCPADKAYTCDSQQSKVCIFQCSTAADCSADYAPAAVKTSCTGSALGCTCDYDPSSELSVCNTKGCGTDADCPAGVCQDGQCITSPTQTVDSCQVFPEYQVLEAGQSYTFSVQAYNGTKPVHVPAGDVTWSVAASASLTNSGAVFTATVPTSVAPAAGVQASVNGHSCTANVLVYPAATGMRVVVIDALAGVPLVGASVVIDSAPAVVTDANGIATGFTGVTGSSHTVTAYAQGFDYVTLSSTSATDILIPVTRDTDVNQGGVTGKINNLFTADSKIQAGFVGMSIAGSITDISTSLLEGPTKQLTGSLGGKSFGPIGVPSGILIGLNGQPFTGGDSYTALGSAGWCGGANGPANTAAGLCGTRGIWALAGEINIDQISPLIDQISGSGLGDINIGAVLTSLLPVLRNFNSIAVRDQALVLGPLENGAVGTTDLAAMDLDNKVSTQGAVTDAVNLSLQMTVKVPVLPKLGGSYVDGALVIGASEVPGRGIFPLGITAGVDNTGTTAAPVVDGHVSYKDASGVEHTDAVQLNMAPAHAGLESGYYRMVVLAASFSNIANGLVGSGIVSNPGACTAANSNNGICYGATVDSGGTFMTFPEASSYDYAGRSFLLGTFPTGSSLGRVSFSNGADHRWFIYFDPSATSVTVPTPPATFEDRTFTDASASVRSELLVLTMDLGSATSANAYTFGSTGAGLQQLDHFINRFAIKDYPPPTITINSPSAGATVVAGSEVDVSISGDGTNPGWRTCFSTTSAAITDVSSCTAGNPIDSTGAGVGTVPTGASGAGYIHAVLVDGSGDLLQPSVESSVAVTVN